MNERATELVDAMVEESGLLRVKSHTLENGARIIDAGVETDGGYGAGLALSEICMGGLGDIAYTTVQAGAQTWPGVLVSTDHPAVSCMASQYAGWAVSVDKFFAMGSGPLRSHARVEQELFEKLDYAEEAKHGVLVLEGRVLPDAAVAAWVAEKSRLKPASSASSSLRPRASRAGCRSPPGSWRPACTRWRRSASTYGGS
jgi:methenyltetrahydromethanopterin cyclohydrolase